LKGYEIEQ